MNEPYVERIEARARKLFAGETAYAQQWLRTPQAQLGGRAPLELLNSETGARAVEAILLGIEHGVFA
ncbi:MAG: antitoxin Xre/MbcA/ParS toxin-binding domain-containing protein [Steroidobacteraceae bacterium]